VLAGAVVLAGIGAAVGLRRGDELHHFTETVTKGTIKDTVEATGTVNAVVNVQVGSQVSGTIAELGADYNSRVARGDVIALIDSQVFVGELEQARADLESALANLVAAEASLKKTEAGLEQTRAEHERQIALAKQSLVTDQSLEVARANHDSAAASVDVARAGVVQARAQVGQKQAAVAVARTNLERTVIRSPIDGVVVARNVDRGQTVAASLQAPTIFTIAQDLKRMLVYAKVDESDVGRIRPRQPVTFRVDAFPKDVFKGIVTQVRMNPTTVQNVVTYDAVVEFGNPDLKLFPGMTAYITIPVATAEDVVKVPNAALRYRPPLPPDTVRALYAKHGLEEKEREPGASESVGPESAVVWKRVADGSIQPVRILIGITDHASTEVVQVVNGTLAPGDEVVTSSVLSKSLPLGLGGLRR
jgi:HlyD family secretion protein